MRGDEFLNTHIKEELLQTAREMLAEGEVEDPERAVMAALEDTYTWYADQFGILWKYGDLDRLWETPVYQQAVAACVEEISEELKEERR